MAKMIRYKRNSGKSLLEFVDPAWTKSNQPIIKAFNREGSEQYEYSFPHRNGSHVDTVVTLGNIQREKTENRIPRSYYGYNGA